MACSFLRGKPWGAHPPLSITHRAVCCSVLQCVAVCCSVLQCVTVCCSVLQCVAACYSVLLCVALCRLLPCVTVCCSGFRIICWRFCGFLCLTRHTFHKLHLLSFRKQTRPSSFKTPSGTRPMMLAAALSRFRIFHNFRRTIREYLRQEVMCKLRMITSIETQVWQIYRFIAQ